ncbi:MAG: hypothetical protein MMC33_006375 [Icmadophila ericetorum]|nr:hypothetical protein [Icmadophila ericetorum]
MVTESPPGRPGNLTSEQEVKLKEFWKLTLKVFGVSVENLGLSEEADDEEVEEDASSSVASPEQKKKRKGFFRRKPKGDKVKTDPPKEANGIHIKGGDADDKYGQTKEFQQALADNHPEDLRRAFWSMVKHDNPDGLLLRFLRARKWDVEKALVMLVSTMQWRAKEMHVDDNIILKGEGYALAESQGEQGPARKKEGEDFLAQLRLGKSFLHGMDKEGRPMCFVRARLHRAGEQSEPSLERYTVYTIETARLFLSPPVDTAAIVFDLTGFSMANMDYTPVKFMIKCFEANYPESLGVVLVHHAPWVFQGIWKIIKGWLDPVVAAKVHFTNDLKDLEEFIPKNHIIKELGGDDDYQYEYKEPQPGEDDLLQDTATRDKKLEERAATVKEYEITTCQWMHAPIGDKEYSTKRSSLAESLRRGYWQLDPYLRARTIYDRIGLIKQDGTGTIVYYPGHEKTAAATPVATTADAKETSGTHADDVD